MAIAHDWLVTIGGAERVLGEMLALYPEATLYSLIDCLDEQQRSVIAGMHARTSFLQSWPWVRKYYRQCLPAMPFAVESLDLSSHDIVLSSCYSVIKGVITGPDQLHICYCYSPMRYAWDLQAHYLAQSNLDRGLKGALARALLLGIRIWDLRTAPGVDRFIAISHYIARRIQKVYGRDASVIYPPVDVDYFQPAGSEREEYYITASRLVPYKRIDLIVEAFAGMPSRKLIVIGDGPEMEKIRPKCAPNIELLGYQSRESLRAYLQRARAFVFAAEEDFGIAPLEAQSCGTPVIAYGRGGALETIAGLDERWPTGVHFPEQSVACVRDAIERFEAHEDEISHDRCREHSLQFSPARFRQELHSYIDREWTAFNRSKRNCRLASAAFSG